MLKIIIVDNDELTIHGATLCLQRDENIKVIGSFNSGEELIAYIIDKENTKPDIILLDMKLTEGEPSGGVKITKKVKAIDSNIKIIIMSGEYNYSSSNNTVVIDAIEAGASGFISKNVGAKIYDDVINAIYTINRGDKYFFNAPIMEIIVDRLRSCSSGINVNNGLNPLTKEEIIILQMIAAGMIAEKIADVFNANNIDKKYTRRQIQKTQENIASKLGVINNSNAIIVKAIQNGFLLIKDIKVKTKYE